MIFSLRIMRMVAALMTFLTAGVAGPLTCVAESIGDPWWDDVMPADAEAEPRLQAQPGERAQQGIDRQRRQAAAMNILRRELSLVRGACPSLSVDQRSTIVRAGLQAIDEPKAPGQAVVGPKGVDGAAGGIQVEVQARDRVPAMPGMVVDAVAKAVGKVASAEEIEAYHREIAARAARRQAAALAILVDVIDQTAMLDPAKRDELAVALEKNWQPFWEQAALHIGQSPNSVTHLPPGVAAVAAEVLGPEAFEVWQARLRREAGS